VLGGLRHPRGVADDAVQDPGEHGGLVLAIAGVQIFLVNRTFLPRPLQAPWWRQAMLLACSAFYAFFAFFVVKGLFTKSCTRLLEPNRAIRLRLLTKRAWPSQ
jgi:hypothetical protein